MRAPGREARADALGAVRVVVQLVVEAKPARDLERKQRLLGAAVDEAEDRNDRRGYPLVPEE